MATSMTVIFVHGWSVHHTNTYGHLPHRLQIAAAASGGPVFEVREIWLSKYVSFRDEVRLEDLSRGLEAALRKEFANDPDSSQQIALITHSTGGPVARDWMYRNYLSKNRQVPVSHLIMLAPANFGSALAQLGKARVGRIMAWYDGVEPGQGVLDWLELGSPEAWKLNSGGWRDSAEI